MKDEILKILTESELFTIVDNIKDSTVIQLSIPKRDVYEDLNFNFKGILIKELISQIYNSLNSYIIENSEDGYCDILKNSIEDIEGSNILSYFIKSIPEKKCITNGRYISLILDSFYVSTIPFNNFINNSNGYLPYKSFDINNTLIFTDPYLNYNDNKLITFYEILIDVKSVSILDNEFNIKLRFEYGIGVKNPKVYYVIESEKSYGYKDFIKKVRRGRIKGIVKE